MESLYKHVDELVIIDSGATDGTIDIVKEYTDRIIFNELVDFATQRNFATKQCKGEWIFMLDADEVVGANFSQAKQFLTDSYRSVALPRYNIVNADPVTFITTKPHYLDWQNRFFRNDGKSYFVDPIHHKLVNYRRRLKCAVAQVFHLDFLFNSYEARIEKVNRYEQHRKGSGYPRMYLFEDYEYKTAKVIEQLDPKIASMLKADQSLLHYKEYQANQAYENFLYHTRCAVTKARAAMGV